MLVIGDVCGKGARAAGVTALARHTLRAAAMLGLRPTAMLGTLHAALRRQPAGADLCTVCLVTLERHGAHARLKVALAGHPPPLVMDADGECRKIGTPGTLLGVLDPIDVKETEVQLSPGQTLLLYTDGLPEAGRAGPQLDDERLFALCAQASQATLEGLLEQIERAALDHAGGRLRDDIALLALRMWPETPTPAEA
jgi:serine phosphatase RsbU (regulator of sigma subunit)